MINLTSVSAGGTVSVTGAKGVANVYNVNVVKGNGITLDSGSAQANGVDASGKPSGDGASASVVAAAAGDVQGDITIMTGAGNDQITLGNIGTSTAEAQRTLTINAGAGEDTLNITNDVDLTNWTTAISNLENIVIASGKTMTIDSSFIGPVNISGAASSGNLIVNPDTTVDLSNVTFGTNVSITANIESGDTITLGSTGSVKVNVLDSSGFTVSGLDSNDSVAISVDDLLSADATGAASGVAALASVSASSAFDGKIFVGSDFNDKAAVVSAFDSFNDGSQSVGAIKTLLVDSDSGQVWYVSNSTPADGVTDAEVQLIGVLAPAAGGTLTAANITVDHS